MLTPLDIVFKRAMLLPDLSLIKISAPVPEGEAPEVAVVANQTKDQIKTKKAMLVTLRLE